MISTPDRLLGRPAVECWLAEQVGPDMDRVAALTERYESECNEESQVQWGFLTYNASTPGDSNVEFRVRTAQTEAELESATFVDLITAQASTDTQVCGFAGPAPRRETANDGGQPPRRS